MKPSLVADEMFPEGAGPYMDIEEVSYIQNDPYLIHPLIVNLLSLAF